MEHIFKNKPTFIVAGGPSFNEKQLRLLEGQKRIITVNNSFEKLPDAEVCYAGDYTWWNYYHNIVKNNTTSSLWTGNRQSARKFRLNHVDCRMGITGISSKFIVHGGNSGYQALNLAHLWGASPIILLGFDCNYGPNQKRHHYRDHPKEFGSNGDGIVSWKSHFEEAARAFKQLNKRVINCSPDSAIRGFEKGELEDWIS